MADAEKVCRLVLAGRGVAQGCRVLRAAASGAARLLAQAPPLVVLVPYVTVPAMPVVPAVPVLVAGRLVLIVQMVRAARGINLRVRAGLFVRAHSLQVSAVPRQAKGH